MLATLAFRSANRATGDARARPAARTAAANRQKMLPRVLYDFGRSALVAEQAGYGSAAAMCRCAADSPSVEAKLARPAVASRLRDGAKSSISAR